MNIKKMLKDGAKQVLPDEKISARNGARRFRRECCSGNPRGRHSLFLTAQFRFPLNGLCLSDVPEQPFPFLRCASVSIPESV